MQIVLENPGADIGALILNNGKEYGNLPEVQCFPGQLNQVFINLIANCHWDSFSSMSIPDEFWEYWK